MGLEFKLNLRQLHGFGTQNPGGDATSSGVQQPEEVEMKEEIDATFGCYLYFKFFMVLLLHFLLAYKCHPRKVETKEEPWEKELEAEIEQILFSPQFHQIY